MSPRDDLYVVVGMVKSHYEGCGFSDAREYLDFILWLGAVIAMLGSVLALWPEHALEERGVWRYARAATSVASTLIFSLLLAGGAARGFD